MIISAPESVHREDPKSGIFSIIRSMNVLKHVLLQLWGYKKRLKPIISAPESACCKESESGIFSKIHRMGIPKTRFLYKFGGHRRLTGLITCAPESAQQKEPESGLDLKFQATTCTKTGRNQLETHFGLNLGPQMAPRAENRCKMISTPQGVQIRRF